MDKKAKEITELSDSDKGVRKKLSFMIKKSAKTVIHDMFFRI